MLNHFKVAALALVLAGSAGCTEGEKYLRVNPVSIELAASELGTGITVEATAAWMADFPKTADWLSGFRYDDGGVLWVTVASANEDLEARATEITIVSGDGLTVTVPIVQFAMDVMFDVSPLALEPFDGQGRISRVLTIDTNLENRWEFSAATDWLIIARGTDDDANTLTITTKPSREIDERRDTIIVRPTREDYASLARTIPVVQKGLELLVIAEGLMNPESYALELPAAGSEAGGGVEAVLTVIARAGWTVSVADDPEGRATLDLDGGDADLESGVTLVLTVAENLSTTEYTFTLVFECADETYEYQVVQAAAAGREDEDGAGA